MMPHYLVLSAADAADAGDSPTILADCSATIPIINEAAVLPDGSLIIAGGTEIPTKGGSINLYRVTGVNCAARSRS